MARGRRTRRRDEGGVVAIVSALVSITLLVVSAFVVDLGMTWERRGKLQVQADKAAVFAAQALPAVTPEQRLAVAKRVAYYLACNDVPGQRAAAPAIPNCPSSTSASALDSYAASLIAEGMVSFPTSTQVRVVTPKSRVDFAFAGAVGVKDTEQAKTAVAKVSSPGEILPVGLSLQCLAGVANQASPSLGSVLPLSYITVGATSASGILPPGLPDHPVSSWPAPYGSSTHSGVTVDSATVQYDTVTGDRLRLVFSAPNLVALENLLGGLRVAFVQGTPTGGTTAPIEVGVPAGGLAAGGIATVPLPEAVKAVPGLWFVKIKSNTDLLGLFFPRWSHNDVSFAYLPGGNVKSRLQTHLSGLLDLRDTIACGRLLDSPRPQDGGTPALTRNLQEGLDHALTSNPAFAQLSPSLDVAQLVDPLTNEPLDLVGELTDCAPTITANRLDTVGTWHNANLPGGAPANCARISTSATAEQEFTDGLLKATATNPTEPGYGRLHCSREGACEGPRTTLTGFGTHQYNDDAFGDFVTGGGTLLHHPLAFNLDTYLFSDLPLVTPNERIDPAIYSSPRFGWAPVLGHVDLNSAAARDFPVLTFRPVFIDNGEAVPLELLGVNLSGVVDPAVGYLAQRVQEALSQVQAGMGALQHLLTSALSALGLSPLVARLGNLAGLDVEEILTDLADGLDLQMSEEAGLLLEDGIVKAARFMTIAPGGLPAVPEDYDGPLTDYVGIGPKIIRLVR